MDYEEKYKQVLEKAKKELNTCGSQDCDAARQIFSLFPELKESEDEKTRKALIEMVHDTTGDSLWIDYNVHKSDAIAWLEKQGEQKASCTTIVETGDSGINALVTKDIEIPFGAKDSELQEASYHIPEDFHAEIEGDKITIKKGEQKPFDYENANIQQKDFAPKVESKFKVGDWVARGNVKAQIIGIEDNKYCFNGYKVRCSTIDKQYHIWTIQDAKNGDVLASKDKEDILIYKSHSVIDLLLTSHISFSKKEGFCPRQYSAWDSNEFVPATKEQRDLLFTKMKEAGYEWDTENKQLKKISQRMISAEAKEAMYDRPAWSEEDEKELNSCIEAIEACYKWDTMVDWLKSLKKRYTWKPSDEQMKALHDLNLTGNISYAGQGQTLIELYNDLKKLKGE